MSLPEPGRLDLNSTDGSSWPTYLPAMFPAASTQVDLLLWQRGSSMVPAVSLRTLACEAAWLAVLAALAGSAPATSKGRLRRLSAASLDRFNLCPFAHQRSRGVVVAADGWSYGLPESSGVPARSVSAHSRANPGCSSVQRAARSLRHRDPLRLRAKLNKMNIQPRRIVPKPPKPKISS